MKKLFIDRRALLVSSASALVLAGCSNIIGPPDASTIYLLKTQIPPAPAGQRLAWQLTVEQPDAPDALDSMRIAIVRSTLEMDYYANAQWPDRLPDLVQGALMEGFDATNRISAGRNSDGLRSDYVLTTDITDFQARYDVPDGVPTIVVRINARLVGSRSRAVLQSKSFRIEVPATANSVPAAVDAFDQALATVVSQIVDWTLTAPPPARI
jgi:cholesterol transport system auxiliary component